MIIFTLFTYQAESKSQTQRAIEVGMFLVLKTHPGKELVAQLLSIKVFPFTEIVTISLIFLKVLQVFSVT